MITIPLIASVAFDSMHNPGFTFGEVHSGSYGISVRKKNLLLLPDERNYLTRIIGKHGVQDFGLDFGERIIEFECWANEKNKILLQEKRREIVDWLNPLNGCKNLTFDYDNKIYLARVQDTSNVIELLGSGKFTLSFLCPSPFARNEYAHKVYFVDDIATINRNGSAPTPCVITLTFTNSASYITLTHSNGELIKVTHAFVATDVLEIDTENRTVKINDVNAMTDLDIESTFLELNKGIETITVTPASKASGNLTFFERWL